MPVHTGGRVPAALANNRDREARRPWSTRVAEIEAGSRQTPSTMPSTNCEAGRRVSRTGFASRLSRYAMTCLAAQCSPSGQRYRRSQRPRPRPDREGAQRRNPAFAAVHDNALRSFRRSPAGCGPDVRRGAHPRRGGRRSRHSRRSRCLDLEVDDVRSKINPAASDWQ